MNPTSKTGGRDSVSVLASARWAANASAGLPYPKPKKQTQSPAPNASDDEDLTTYTRKEASAYAKCCLKTIDRDIASGKLLAIKISRRRVRIPKASLKAYQAGKFASGAL